MGLWSIERTGGVRSGAVAVGLMGLWRSRERTGGVRSGAVAVGLMGLWRSIVRTGGLRGVRCEEWGCGCWVDGVVGLNGGV
jgi:hypothetical protein